MLSKKYKGRVGEKILSLFASEMNVPIDFNHWIDILEANLNTKKDRLLKMVFHVFDFNDDGYVSQLDLYAIMKLYENEDEVFIKGYAHDFC